jgi:hypothetical protein
MLLSEAFGSAGYVNKQGWLVSTAQVSVQSLHLQCRKRHRLLPQHQNMKHTNYNRAVGYTTFEILFAKKRRSRHVCCRGDMHQTRALTVPQRQCVTVGFLIAGPCFAPGVVNVGFAVDKLTLVQVYLRVLRFFPVNIILPLFHIHSCII